MLSNEAAAALYFHSLMYRIIRQMHWMYGTLSFNVFIWDAIRASWLTLVCLSVYHSFFIFAGYILHDTASLLCSIPFIWNTKYKKKKTKINVILTWLAVCCLYWYYVCWLRFVWMNYQAFWNRNWKRMSVVVNVHSSSLYCRLWSGRGYTGSRIELNKQKTERSQLSINQQEFFFFGFVWIVVVLLKSRT